ncbi:B-cell receptor CD22 B-lymphocyte cell adhesion molecule [Channa argus]|uniref:B-cell receptor CD22 n=1 Tax=Channa argus TaxID=215402 RepID=A0A6G1PPU2_CHAAH|nr:B-cell receptor CD22 B-lymphocyte cell adhesion molecule [Channa argus]
MMMNALTLGWLVILALIKNFYSVSLHIPMTLRDLNPTATEGSCIDIKCDVTGPISDDNDAYWFWLKDAKWDESNADFIGTVIYSTNTALRPVSPHFEDRVKYIGSLSSSWGTSYNSSPKPRCNILICNLKQSDSGEYSFRYKKGSHKWSTKPNVTLKVTENPCPITFENPPAVMESEQITLTCSTRDAPKEVSAEISSKNIREGHSVTLTCLAKGVPATNISWFKNDTMMKAMSTLAEWTITEIDASYSGEYRCKAQNKHGTRTSATVTVDVTYAPEVEITTTSSEVTEGDKMTLTCSVKRSNPQLVTYTWQKNGANIVDGQTFVVDTMKPEDSGSYTCTANNAVGSGSSPELQIQVKYAPKDVTVQSQHGFEVKENKSLTLSCSARSYPQVKSITWMKTTDGKEKVLKENNDQYIIQSASPSDIGQYSCKAENDTGTGTSQKIQINVKYSPTEPILSMADELTENMTTTITCTVESFPPSQPDGYWPSNNKLQFTFNVTSAHDGLYTCSATNTEGPNTSKQRKLVVKCQ